MQICFYTDTYFPLVGGAEMVLHHLASELAGAGDGVAVLAPTVKRAGGSMPASLPYRVYRYRKPFSKRFGLRLALGALSRTYWHERFQILHCHAAYPQPFVAASFKQWLQIPMVVRPHGNDILPNGRIRRHRRLERRLKTGLAQADAIVAQGQFLKETLLDLGIDREQICVIPNGVDLEPFNQWEPFPHPRPYVLAVGNLIPRKGFDLLLEAWARILPSGVDLLIAGDGPERSRLHQQAQELGIRDRARFLGFVEGQPKVNLYRSAQFFVCPSRMEPFGNVILEAFAAGLPVVASDVGGNSELVAHQDRGLLFPTGHVSALAEAMQRLLQQPDLSRMLGNAAAHYIQDLSWPRVARRYRALYQSLIER